MRVLKYIKLPNMKKISLRNLASEGNKDIDGFLQNSFPDEVQYFYIFGKSFSNSCISINKYIDKLAKCIPKVTKELCIWNFKMSSSQFSDI